MMLHITDRFILGYKDELLSISPSELYKAKKDNNNLKIWCDCFVKILIDNNLQVSDFIMLYEQYLMLSNTKLEDLQVLPLHIIGNRELTIKYIEALMYCTFKRNSNHEITN